MQAQVGVAADGELRMLCRVTDVLGREGAFGKSLVPNPFARSGEKQFKETGAVNKALYPTVVYKWFMVNIGKSYLGTVRSAISNFGGRSKHKMIVSATASRALARSLAGH